MDSSSTGQPSETPELAKYAPGYMWAAKEAIDRHGALQVQAELAVVMCMMHNAEPHVILEIGTWAGGSAWAWSRIPTVNHIVTVDLDPRPEAQYALAALPCRTDQITGDSGHPAIIDKVSAALDGYRPDVLIIDGAHEYPKARRDWDVYSPVVAPGGLVVIHDTQGYPGNDTVQVPRLWAELRASYRAVEIVAQPGGPGGTGLVWV